MSKMVKLAAGSADTSGKETRYLPRTSELEVGTSVEGIFKNTYRSEGDYGPTETHYIETADEVIGINGSTVLNGLMARVEKGSQVRIVYTGLGEKAKGKKPPFLFDVFVPEAAASKQLED